MRWLGKENSLALQPATNDWFGGVQTRFADVETSKESIREMLTQLAAFVASGGSSKLDQWVIYLWSSIALALFCVLASRYLVWLCRKGTPTQAEASAPGSLVADPVGEIIRRDGGDSMNHGARKEAEAKAAAEAAAEAAMQAALEETRATEDAIEGANDMVSFATEPRVEDGVPNVEEVVPSFNVHECWQEATEPEQLLHTEPPTQEALSDAISPPAQDALSDDTPPTVDFEKELTEQRMLSAKSEEELETARGQLAELHTQVQHDMDTCMQQARCTPYTESCMSHLICLIADMPH
jgi:hypothetical protein